MSPARRVAVIGAGIVGVSTTIWLQRAGYEVVLIDRAGPGAGTSYGNAGVLAASSVVPVTTPGLAARAPRMLLDPDQPLFLRWAYLPRLLPWLRRYLGHCTPDEVRRIARALLPLVGDSLQDHRALAAGTPADRWIVPCDYLFAYRDRAAFDADSFGWQIRREQGFDWETLEGAALRAAEPALSPALGFAVRLPGHGRIADPGRYVRDLAAHAKANGARLVTAEVADIARENGAVTGVRAGGETIPCDACVVAAGVWSRRLAAQLGVEVAMESERGYHVELWGADRMPRSPVMVAAGKFVATPMEGRLRLAGVVEFAGLDAPAREKPLAMLERNIETTLPGITWRETRRWMGHRPAPSDSIPVIGAVPGLDGAWLGFGHHHVGLTAGPKTGRILAQLISGERPNFDLEPYAPMRSQWGRP